MIHKKKVLLLESKQESAKGLIECNNPFSFKSQSHFHLWKELFTASGDNS